MTERASLITRVTAAVKRLRRQPDTKLYIFLNPDGTQKDGLYALIESSTGIEYAAQTGGYANEMRSAEGFLIPLGDAKAAQPLIAWFQREFAGHSYPPVPEWTQTRIDHLSNLVCQIPCWHTSREGNDRREMLQLDKSRIDECTEAWVPVITPFGPGILLFANCD